MLASGAQAPPQAHFLALKDSVVIYVSITCHAYIPLPLIALLSVSLNNFSSLSDIHLHFFNSVGYK